VSVSAQISSKRCQSDETDQLGQQDRQLEEVRRPEVRPSSGQDYERVHPDHVRPSRWQRPHLSLSGLSEEHSVFNPGVGEADQYSRPCSGWNG
jgi:hypothetical protein